METENVSLKVPMTTVVYKTAEGVTESEHFGKLNRDEAKALLPEGAKYIGKTTDVKTINVPEEVLAQYI